jgi:HK97 gp10 family phage protein
MSVTVLGVPETIAAFERFAIEVEAASATATQAGGHVVAAVMRAQAPKDTGRLAASIQVRRDGDDAIVGADVPYDRFVQKGTIYMDAQPYAEQAGEKASSAAMAAVAAVFKAVMR